MSTIPEPHKPIVLPDSFHDVSLEVIKKMGRISISASLFTHGILLSLLFPLGFILILILAAIMLIQAHALCREFPCLKHPMQAFPDNTRSEVRSFATKNLKLSRILEFSVTRVGLWVYLSASIVFIVLKSGILIWA